MNRDLYIHSFGENRRGFSGYPFLLGGLHTLFFFWLYPQLDLPVYDDANYFAFAILFSGSKSTLYGDWSPILTYFAALLYNVLPLSKITLYAIYTYGCELIFVLGVYFFIARFTRDARWAFWSTLLIVVTLSYPFFKNAHKLPAGLLFFLLAWADRKKQLNLFECLSLVLLSILLRVEYVILAGGFALGYAVRTLNARSWKTFFQPSRSSVLLVLLTLALWTPVFLWGTLHTNRFLFAFGEKFQIYAFDKGLYEKAHLSENVSWQQVLDTFFPPDRRNESRIGRLFPLYTIATADPALFREFLWENTKSFRRAVFSFSEAEPVSSFLSIYALAGLAMLVARVLSAREWDKSWYLYWGFIFALSVVPSLFTSPIRIYLLPAVVWFACVVPFFWLGEIKRLAVFFTVLILLVCFYQWIYWNNDLFEHHKQIHRHRAETLRLAQQDEAFHDVTLAEAFPIFSVAFGDAVVDSYEYNVGWDPQGLLRANDGVGPVIQYLLLEQPTPRHPYFDRVSFLDDLVKKFGVMVADHAGYTIWKILPLPVKVTDDVDHQQGVVPDLAAAADEDPPDHRQLVIQWFIPDRVGDAVDGAFMDFHVWVQVDGQEKQYLGRTGSGSVNRLVWQEGAADLNPAFANGPEFDHRYEFIVFGIPQGWNAKKAQEHPEMETPQPYYTRGPVRFLQATPGSN